MIALYNSTVRRTVSVLLSLLILVCFAEFAVYPVRAFDFEQGCVPSELFEEASQAVKAEDWVPDAVTGISVISRPDGNALRLYSKTGTSEITANFPEGIPVNSASEIGVYLKSITTNECTAVFTAVHGKGTSTVSAKLQETEECYIFLPLPKGTDFVYTVSLKLTSETESDNGGSTASVSAIVRKSVFSDTDHSNNIKSYSAFSVSGIDTDGKISGTEPVSGSALVCDASNGSFAAVVKLSGSTGGITFHFSSDGKSYEVCGSSVISKERMSYIFPVGNITSDSAYRIEFTGTEGSDTQLLSVSFIPIITHDRDEHLGAVSKCTFADDTVTVSGSITRDAAVKYINGDVCLYEIPVWADADKILAGEPADSMKMSTSFSFSLSTTEDYSVFNSYVVAIRDKDGVYPLSSPLYPSFSHSANNKSVDVSVSGILPEDAFIYGFDSYVMDIDLSELILDKGGRERVFVTYDGYTYYLDKGILSDIDRNARFLSSAGISVIFRITSSPSNSISSKSADDCRMLAAVTAFISDKYSPDGIIFGMEENSASHISQKAYRTASLLRMVSEAGNGVTVLVPVDPSENGEAFAWLLGKYLSLFPKSNIEMLIKGKTGDPDISDGVMACASDGGFAFSFTLSRTLNETSPVNVSELTMGSTGISYLIEASGESLSAVSGNSESYVIKTDFSDTGKSSVTLWDFTESYDSAGFTVPAGVTGIFTGTDDALEDFMGIPAVRSLKTVLGEDSGVIIAEPSLPMNLEHYPNVRFLLSGNADSPFSVDIVFISGKQRAVFTADFGKSGVFAPVCDLSETDIAGRIERIAIVLKSGGPAELGIASVCAYGDGGDRDIYITEMPNNDNASGTEEISHSSIPAKYLAMAVLAVTTVIMFAVLTRRKAK